MPADRREGFRDEASVELVLEGQTGLGQKREMTFKKLQQFVSS